MSDNLTTKQRVFVSEYLTNGFNATQAALSAGYKAKSARSIGSENLTKPNISALIEKRMKDMAMSADEALLRLSMHARGTMSDFIDPKTGKIDLVTAAAAGKLHLLKKVSVDTAADKIAIELYDAQAALVHILKEQHLRAGEATDRTDMVVMDDAQRADRIAELLDAARARRNRQTDQSGIGYDPMDTVPK